MGRKHIRRMLRRRIFERDGHRCVYCGSDGSDGRKLTLDHRTAHSRGGDEGEDNLVVACWPCNRRKWTSSADEFAAIRQSMVTIEDAADMIGVSVKAIRVLCFITGIKLFHYRSSWLMMPDEPLKLGRILHDA